MFIQKTAADSVLANDIGLTDGQEGMLYDALSSLSQKAKAKNEWRNLPYFYVYITWMLVFQENSVYIPKYDG